MTTTKHRFSLAAAFAATAATLTFTSSGLAQDEDDPFATQAPGSGTEEPADPVASTEEVEPAAAEEVSDGMAEDAAPEDAAPEAPAEATAAPAVSVTTKDKTQSGEDPKSGGWPVKQFSIVQTPWSAFPSQQVRGLTYGSLWRTFHGDQWPYMPKTEDTPEPTFQIGWSGNIWNDISFTHIDVDESRTEANQNRWNNQARATLRMTPTLNVDGDWFVQGNAEIVVQGDMIASNASGGVLATTDDLWIRAGKWRVFDVQVGRFQGWEIANHFGMALDWQTLERQGAWVPGSSIQKPTDGYGLDYFWDRQNYLLGGYAVHLYPTKWLRGELMGHIGAGSGAVPSPNTFDVRPAAIVDLGWLKLKAGYEFGKSTPQDETTLGEDQKNGWGLAAQMVFAPYVEFGGSFARAYQDIVDARDLADLAGSNTAQSAGGFVNFSPGHEPLLFGAGLFLKEWENFRPRPDGAGGTKVDTNRQWLFYGAVQYTLWRQLYLKLVVSHASNEGDYNNGGYYVNNALSGRLRVELLF